VAAALAAFVLVSWLFRAATVAVALRNEIQFLFPRRFRGERSSTSRSCGPAASSSSSFVLTLFLGRRGAGPPWQTAVGMWLVFPEPPLPFHGARLHEALEKRTPGRRLAHELTAIVVLAVLAVLAVTVVDGIPAAGGLQGGRSGSLIRSRPSS
jgi:hypothetical protein